MCDDIISRTLIYYEGNLFPFLSPSTIRSQLTFDTKGERQRERERERKPV